MPFVKREGGGGAFGESSGGCVVGGLCLGCLHVVCVASVRWASQMCVCSQQGSSVARGVRQRSKVRVLEGDMVYRRVISTGLCILFGLCCAVWLAVMLSVKRNQSFTEPSGPSAVGERSISTLTSDEPRGDKTARHAIGA